MIDGMHPAPLSINSPSGIDLNALEDLAERGLIEMFDTEQRLFCFTFRPTLKGMQRQGVSRRYTMIALLGLHRLESTRSSKTAVPIGEVCNRLCEDLHWIDNIGDVGLLLWLSALASPHHLTMLIEKLELDEALANCRLARSGSTTELAWLLTGTVYAMRSRKDLLPKLEPLGEKVFHRLIANQGPHGFFGHLATRWSGASFVRGRFGSFADQAYPIYALSRFGQFRQRTEAVERARRCADALCSAQGRLGQWWWHYDARSGRIAQRFPAYSVHQHGMAPMALFAAAEATGADYTAFIYRGIGWVARNELNEDLRDPFSKVVWRGVQNTSAWQMYFREGVDYLIGSTLVPNGLLKINHECRPYELGWLLYAFAGNSTI